MSASKPTEDKKPAEKRKIEQPQESESAKRRKVAFEYLLELEDGERKQFLESMKKEAKDRAREKKYTPLSDEQKQLAGTVFSARSTTGHSPPSFVRLIGYNKSAKSAIVEKVPSVQKDDGFLQGGSSRVDKKWLEEHPFKSIVRVAGSFTEQGRYNPKEKCIKIPGHSDEYFILENLDQEFMWCCD